MAEDRMQNVLKDLPGIPAAVTPFERWFYSHDIVELPPIVRRMFNTIPEAVLRPQNTDQVAAVLKRCGQEHIPVVARGGGSSGLFAAVPRRGGVVLDMTGMNAVLAIDKENLTVTVQAGASWWELERALNKEWLTLKSYPSSARSATVAGWIMTGGLGIGSLKYGNVHGQVISMQMVHGDGSVKVYGKGSGTEQFFETEGTLGIMTQAILEVRPMPEAVSHIFATFDDIHNLFRASSSIAGQNPPPYNIEFFDGQYVAMLNTAGYHVPETGPGGGVLLVTCDGAANDVQRQIEAVRSVLGQCHGQQIDGAEEHWRERFKILRVRRAVPDLVLSSVYVPTSALDRMQAGLAKMKKRPLALLGYIIAPTECNLMPLFPVDTKHPIRYLFALHTPREITNLAAACGGKPGGGVGLWNAPYAKNIFGEERYARLKQVKRNLDPAGIVNPVTWEAPPLLFTPAVYQTAMASASVIDKILPAPRFTPPTGFRAELEACVQCGYCTNYCPTRLDWLSTTPRGRVLATRELFLETQPADIAPEYVTRLYQCTMCGRCGVDCSVDIKSRAMWLGTRKHMGKRGMSPDSLKAMVKLVDEKHNISGRANETRDAWTSRVKLPFDLKGKRTAPVVYFVGCVASFFPMVQPTARAFVGLMNTAGVDFSIVGGEEWCCGFPLLAAGNVESTRRHFLHNVEQLKNMGAQTVVMTCPGCYKTWKEEYMEVTEERHPFTVLHSTEFLSQLQSQKKLTFKPLENRVTYHDPCDLGRNGGLFDEPRHLLKSVPGLDLVEMENNREYCTCCGSGGDLLASNQDVALAIAGRKLKEIMATGAASVATACPSCVRAISMAKTTEKAKLEVMDITELLWGTVKISV